MILETAVLNIRSGEATAFEKAFAEARQFIASVEGYRRHELRRCIEVEDRYLLLVWWDTLESHTRNFRESSGYERWSALLHHFYEPFPEVEHYALVSTCPRDAAAESF